ncbi:MAG: hypothetical protein Q8868_06255 [Bacteroidota bacterium]|nr:hypothetical protein [Bacteroidota bacterium]
MSRSLLYCLASFWLLILFQTAISDPNKSIRLHSTDNQNNKELLNGRIWRNEYLKAVGNQYFLTNTFLKGTVIFNGKKFNNLDLQYDIASDELILRIESCPVIILNKEMVDSFSLVFENRSYNVFNAGTDTSSLLRGYINVLYDGPSTLYVKYSKKLYPLAVDGKYDLFYQEHRVFVKKGSEIVLVSGRRKFLCLLDDKKKEIRHYMRTERIRISHRDPGTYVKVLRFYDSIRQAG